MKLTSTNRYLRDPEVRETTVTRSVATSSAIEGIRTPCGHHPRKPTRGQGNIVNRSEVLHLLAQSKPALADRFGLANPALFGSMARDVTLQILE